ncbi:hypothetical protein FTO68_08395 [Methanocalculus taiwanensis]|uniref:Uncharacterized protein n=1 Tax=Methanocalculus taiwanensis TaxID=106207 RepID=A0ABD4TNZ7_9EURY|nr:hypothetical protein [Methanocalculus taiwanensis]MCQ1538995.1 hypothetical protein [Methanocalculus taiwanensis]
MTAKIALYIKGAATLVFVAIAMFLLFGTFVEFLETSAILFAALVVYVLYCGTILPAIDRWVAGRDGGAADKAPRTQSDAFNRLPRRFRYSKVIVFISVLVISFFILHLLVLMMHEFSHSTLAWLLGAKADPLNIIYGDLIGSGWDENVDYSVLFNAGRGSTAAAIAFAGPFSNIALFFITAGLMATGWVKERRWAYHTVFWTSVITFIMIFEYVLTRSFMTHDDFGNINHGLGISPWPIFITGTILGLIGLYYLYAYKLPEYFAIMTPDARTLQYISGAVMSFIIFLFYIGLRITSYPEIPQWWFGTVGIAMLFGAPFIASPARTWMLARMREYSTGR